MTTPSPPRWMYFPPRQIFGRTIVPLYYTEVGPAIPLSEVTRVLGVSDSSARRLLEKNREVISLADCRTGKALAAKEFLAAVPENLCLNTEAICLFILALDPADIPDPQARHRLLLAKQWLVAQIANRLKVPGKKYQPRWDKGLTREQARRLKKRFPPSPSSP